MSDEPIGVNESAAACRAGDRERGPFSDRLYFGLRWLDTAFFLFSFPATSDAKGSSTFARQQKERNRCRATAVQSKHHYPAIISSSHRGSAPPAVRVQAARSTTLSPSLAIVRASSSAPSADGRFSHRSGRP